MTFRRAGAVLLVLATIIATACAQPPTASPTAAPQPAAASNPTAPSKPASAAKPAANDQAVADFYRGKTIRFVVGYAPGGGFDSYARLISKYLGKYVPGNPNVIVENMPGAGSTVAANHLFKVAEKDGTVIGTFNELQLINQLIGRQGIEFDLRQFSWIGSAYSGQTACVARKDTGITSLSDLIGGKQLIMGGTAPGAETDDFPRVLKEVLGANIKMVSGFDGTSKIRVAVESGEVDGACWSWQSMQATAASWFESNYVNVFTWQGEKPHPTLDKLNAPKAETFAKTEEEKALVRIVASPAAVAKPYVAPPGIPAERLQALRNAFAATFADPAFRADAEKAKLDIDFSNAADVERVVNSVLTSSPQVANRLGTLLK